MGVEEVKMAFQVKENDVSDTDISTNENFEDGARVNVSFGDKFDGFNVSLSISKNVPEGVPYQSYIKELSEDFYKFFKERRQRFVKEQIEIKKGDPEPSWKKKGGSKNNTPPQNNQGGLGVCRDCGAPMKMSKNNKPYCSAVCWQ